MPTFAEKKNLKTEKCCLHSEKQQRYPYTPSAAQQDFNLYEICK